MKYILEGMVFVEKIDINSEHMKLIRESKYFIELLKRSI